MGLILVLVVCFVFLVLTAVRRVGLRRIRLVMCRVILCVVVRRRWLGVVVSVGGLWLLTLVLVLWRCSSR